jgi:hypothetical protein
LPKHNAAAAAAAAQDADGAVFGDMPDADRAEAARRARLGPLLVAVTGASPLIRQVYINTADSLNIIYPAGV